MQPSLQDIVGGFDPTGAASISGAQLLQLVSGAVPFIDKGFILTTIDDNGGNPNVPDAVTNTKWQGYLWRRISATSVGIYVWDTNSASGVLLQWQSINIAGIGIGSIVDNMIQDN